LLRPWRCCLSSAQARGRGLLQRKYRSDRDRRLEAFGRVNVLATLTSRRPACRCRRGTACLRGAPIVPRLGPSGVGLRRHRRGLNEARKNAARSSRWRDDFRWRFGGGGLERGYRDAIRLLVKSCRDELRVSPARFRASGIRPSFGLAVFNRERRRCAFQRHPQKSVKLDESSGQRRSRARRPVNRKDPEAR
jgi:hypothetical protein